MSIDEKIKFEISEEVKEKIARSEGKEILIRSEELRDLKPIEIKAPFYKFFKRFCDITISAIASVALLLPMLIIGLAVYIDDPGKILFRQYRVGKNGKRFRLYKFRSMKTDTPKYLSTFEIDNPDQYITKVGKFLRKTSLDELPQLINVLKGDMSLVGPRPLISDEYEIHQMRTMFGVYNIRPGVTGLAQINGRDTVSPVDKVRWDVKYLEHFGFKADIKILIATVPKVFGGNGVVEGYKIASDDQAKPKNKEDISNDDETGK